MTKPHIYRLAGQWWVSRNGHDSFRKGITSNDVSAENWAHVTAMAAVRSRWDAQRMQRLGYIKPASRPDDLARLLAAKKSELEGWAADNKRRAERFFAMSGGPRTCKACDGEGCPTCLGGGWTP